MPDGTIGHAEIQVGDSVLMLADPWRPGPWDVARQVLELVALRGLRRNARMQR